MWVALELRYHVKKPRAQICGQIQASKSLSILDSDDACFVSLLGMLAVSSFDGCDLSINCLKRHVFVKCLSISRQAEVGSESWRHK